MIVWAVFLRRTQVEPAGPPDAQPQAPLVAEARPGRGRAGPLRNEAAPRPTGARAEEVVLQKLRQFVQSRREIVQALAAHFKVKVPAEVGQFFDAVEASRWDELEAVWNRIEAGRKRGLNPIRLHPNLWPAIQETYGVAEQVRKWPAELLLDYGQTVLGALRPGMVYVGGTDPGRFIPLLLNETSEAHRHVMLTQNGLADMAYLDYVRFLYADRLVVLDQADSNRGFQQYIADAHRRALHDRQFPDEPKQLKPGEDVRIIDNRVEVAGRLAVMAINERLLQTLLAKNPDVSFALEESFPFESTYAEAAPLGPIMELRVQDERRALTEQRAAEGLEDWRATTQALLADPQFAQCPEARGAYAKMAAAHGSLFLHRGYTAQAEEALRLATELGPACPDAVSRFVNLLLSQGRLREAVPVVQQAAQLDPHNAQFRSLLEQLEKAQASGQQK